MHSGFLSRWLHYMNYVESAETFGLISISMKTAVCDVHWPYHDRFIYDLLLEIYAHHRILSQNKVLTVDIKPIYTVQTEQAQFEYLVLVVNERQALLRRSPTSHQLVVNQSPTSHQIVLISAFTLSPIRGQSIANHLITSLRNSKKFKFKILYCINSLQSQEGGAIMAEKT